MARRVGQYPRVDRKSEAGRSSPLSLLSATLNYAQEIADGPSEIGHHCTTSHEQIPLLCPDVLCLV
jgi:hypothetical protein